MYSKEASQNPGLYCVSPVNILAEFSLAKLLRFPLWYYVQEMLRFQSLPLHVFQNPSIGALPPHSLNLYKEGDAPFPKPSFTCLI